MLMIGTDELAKRLYEAWARRIDVTQPVEDDHDEEGWRGGVFGLTGHYHVRRTRPRPKWEHLDSIEKGVWRAVAEEAGREMRRIDISEDQVPPLSRAIRLFKKTECERQHQASPITLRVLRVRRGNAWRAGGRTR